MTNTETAPACVNPPTMLQLTEQPFLIASIHRRVQAQAVPPDAAGATALTQQWLGKTRKDWFIEDQRPAGDMIEAGVVLKDHKLVVTGLREIEWGFTRQDPATGGFPESRDAFHSTSVFLIDTERALLVIQQSQPEFKDVEARVKDLIPKVDAAAKWMLRPDVLPEGKEKDSPFTHRKWILAAALGQAALLTGDQSLTEAAAAFAKEGIGLQHEDGLNPERGGFDVSYQMVDALQGARYYTTLRCPKDAALMAAVRRQLVKTCQWEMQKMLPDGSIEVDGSTRMLKETGHDGKPKHTNYKEIIEAMTYTAMITGDPQYGDIARRLAASQHWEMRY